MPSADLKGWSRVPVPPGDPLGKPQWRVEQSGKVLVCEGDGGHDLLLCDREFGDATGGELPVVRPVFLPPTTHR